MSGKAAKAQRKEEKAKNDEFIARRDLMRKEIVTISQKYKIDLRAALQYGQDALVPMTVFVDMREHYEQIAEKTKEAGIKKKPVKNGQANTGLKTKLKV